MVEDTSQVFAAGPPVVARSLGQQIAKENLGGVPVALGAGGTIDNAAPTEEACFDMIRRFLSYMPQNVHELPPTVKNGDKADRIEEALLQRLKFSRITARL
jgi:acetyl-CoA carboxylase carboxyltransferase component